MNYLDFGVSEAKAVAIINHVDRIATDTVDDIYIAVYVELMKVLQHGDVLIGGGHDGALGAYRGDHIEYYLKEVIAYAESLNLKTRTGIRALCEFIGYHENCHRDNHDTRYEDGVDYYDQVIEKRAEQTALLKLQKRYFNYLRIPR